MQDRHAQHADRLTEIDQPHHVRMTQDRLRLADVSLHRNHPVIAGQQRLIVDTHDRVIVDVHHPGRRIGLTSRFMHARGGRESSAQIDELRQASGAQDADRRIANARLARASRR